jgi:osmoprotectant transport system ATP-binding protein
MIKLSGIGKSYQGSAILRQLNLEFPTGKTTALLGSSGSGKSTILRLITGLTAPDAGDIFFGDERITALNILGIRQRIGYVLQDGGLFPHLTAKQNVTLMANFLRWNKVDLNARISNLAELTKIEPRFLDKFPRQLSGGEKQRVSIMRALMLTPEVLLLDEPLGALDPITKKTLQIDLKEVFKNLNKTVVLVTHDLHEAFFLADFIAILHEGTVAQMGTQRDLIEMPANDFVARFVNAQRNSLFEIANENEALS